MASASVQGDPRRPKEVHSFIRERIDAPRALSDYYSTISLVCGIIAFSLRYKIAAWTSFIFCGAAYANTNNSEADIRQLSWSIMTATSAMVTTYSSIYQQSYTAPSDQAGSSPVILE